MSRVFVGLSGGVDSAVSAAFLKERGYKVVGCFIKIWQPEFLECTWREDRLDAMRVCAALGIPFCEVDLSEEYKREVVDAMLADYAQGITPNPDVLCNRAIKFGHFLAWAREEGAERIATGHYARIAETPDGFELLRGKDNDKDQSYFLSKLGQKELSQSIFPIGELTKREVRTLAKKFDLPNAEKPDSQGLCFVGNVSMADFLARFIPLEEGAVLDTTDRTIGTHRGAALYTVGERHGFRIVGAEGKVPHYVVSIDTAANTITVSPERRNAARKEIVLKNMHWIGALPAMPYEAEAQTRYRETPIRVRLETRGKKMHVEFFEPHIAAPGQTLAVYEDERCLGSGTILG